jgi:hypothetical protein
MSIAEFRRARSLIGEPEQAAPFNNESGHQRVSVRLKGVRAQRASEFGDVYLALALWRGVGLEAFCERVQAWK